MGSRKGASLSCASASSASFRASNESRKWMSIRSPLWPSNDMRPLRPAAVCSMDLSADTASSTALWRVAGARAFHSAHRIRNIWCRMLQPSRVRGTGERRGSPVGFLLLFGSSSDTISPINFLQRSFSSCERFHTAGARCRAGIANMLKVVCLPSDAHKLWGNSMSGH